MSGVQNAFLVTFRPHLHPFCIHDLLFIFAIAIWFPIFNASWHDFSLIFSFFMKLCSPPWQEAHHRKTMFANTVCKLKFPWLKCTKNFHFAKSISALYCQKNNSFRRASGKWPFWKALLSITCILTCTLDPVFVFFILSFGGVSIQNRCRVYLSLEASKPRIASAGIAKRVKHMSLIKSLKRNGFPASWRDI